MRRTDEPQEWRNSCRQPQPHSVLVYFGVVLLSYKVDFHVVPSALQNSIVYVAKSRFLLTPCESQDVFTVKAWLRGNSGGRRHFEYAEVKVHPGSSVPCEQSEKIEPALVVQKVDKAIHWINLYPLNNAIGFANAYPLESDFSGGHRYPTFEQRGPVPCELSVRANF